MKVKQITKRGDQRWLVDGKINGTRQRMFFDTKPQAERWLKAEQQDTTCQNWWLNLSNGDRADMMNAFERSRDIGFTLLSAVDHFAIEGRGRQFLKKMTLREAIGSLGPNKKFKNQGNQPKPSGFLGDKVHANLSFNGCHTIACALLNFKDYLGGDKQCITISAEMIQEWLAAGGVKGKQWELVTKDCYTKHVRNLFNWLIRRDVVSVNPVLKMEKILLDPVEPCILSVGECETILKLCRERHPEVLPLLDLNLFCGIRPSETRRLKTSNFDFDLNEIELKGRQTKTKQRRFVSMSENCLAWLNLQELKLPITDAKHKWEAFLKDAKAALGYEVWPHDCLRHSYCSYGLAHTQNAAQIALEAGHTERVLFAHYRKLVKKPEAEKFWNIYPENARDQFQVVAA